MSYLGRSAKLSLKAQEKVSFLATAGQTSKTGLSYTPSFVEVYVNGVLLTDTTDFTATNGNSVTFTVALLLNDEVTVISLKTFTVADHYTKSDADTLLAAKATNTALALKAPVASPVFTGNVGIGVTPESDIVAGRPHLRIGTTTTLSGSSNNDQTYLSNNAKQVTTSHSTGWEYLITDNASQYKQLDGTHNFLVASSGSADAAISWTTAMTIDQLGSWTHGTVGAGNAFATVYNGGSSGSFVNTGTSNTISTAHAYFTNPNGDVGSIRTINSSTSFNTSSDYRLKTDVQPMTGATDRVKLLKPCNFEWISDGTRVDGFLAHEAQEVVPEAVHGTKDAMMDEEYEVTAATDTEAAVMGTRSVPDMQGIDQAKLVPLLTATIQELIARIEALEGE